MNFALSETWTYQLLLVPIPSGIHSATQLYPGPNSLRHCSSWQGQTQFGSDPRCKTVLLFVSNCSNLFETKNLFEILFSTSTALGFSSLDWMNSPNEMDLPLSIEGSWWAILEVMELCNSGSHLVEASSKVYSTPPAMLVLLVGLPPQSPCSPASRLSDLTEDLKRPLFNRRQLISYQNIMSESLPSGPGTR